MITESLTDAFDALMATLLAAALVPLLWRGRGWPLSTRLLLIAITVLAATVGEATVLQWFGLAEQAEVLEDFLMPLVPMLWLFLFVVEIQRADAARLQRELDHAMAVHNLASHLTVTMEPGAIMDEVVEAASRLTDAALAAILTRDGETGDLVIRSFRGMTAEEAATVRVPVSEGLGGRAFLDRRSCRTDGAGQTFVPSMAAVATRHGVVDGVSVPLLYRGESVGLLNVGKTRGKHFTDGDLTLLETLGAQAAVAIENARLYDRLHRTLDQAMAVHSVAARLIVTMEPQEILEEIVDAASHLLNTSYVAIFMPDDSGRLAARAYRGLTPEEARALTMAPGEGIAGRAFAQKKPYQADRLSDVAMAAGLPLIQREGLRCMVGLPLVFRDQPIGALSVGRKSGGAFDDMEIALLETLCAHAAVAIENARLYERLTESEARYRLLVENAQVAIAVVDRNRHITFWNRGAEILFGWPAQEVLGRHVDRVYQKDKAEEVERIILAGLNRDGKWFGEFPLVRKDGSIFTAFLSLARVFDPAGNIVCTLGIIIDATEQVRLREQLLQAQKMETIGALAGGIAHDFNNLLTAVLGFAGLLKPSLTPGTEDYDAVANIEHAAQRGTLLVRQLMNFSHKQPTRAEPFNLNDVVGEACDLIRRTFPRTVEVTCVLAPDLHLMVGDSTQMHQVVMNLAVNARDAMPEGGQLTLITENLDLHPDDPRGAGLRPGPCVCLTVADTGHGIPPEVRRHIFEPFFTTKPAAGGTGLGLSTVYAIVMRHGGAVTYESHVGRGTTFCVVLPALAPAPTSTGAVGGARPIGMQ